MAENHPDNNRVNLAVITLTAIVWMAGFIPLIHPNSRLWGFNHLIFIDGVFVYVYLACGLTGLSLFIPSIGKFLTARSERASFLFYSKPLYRRWGLFGAAAVTLFWFFRMPTNFLGDGYTAILNVGNEAPIIFKWSEVGATALAYGVSRLLPFSGLESAQYAYALISVLSGGITLFIFCRLAHQLSENSSGRILILALLLFSGWTLLFFGYAESYPVLWPLVTGYVYSSLSYLKGKGNLLLPTILLVVAIFMHLFVVSLVLSYPVILFSRGYGAQFYQKYSKYIWSGLAIAVIAAIYAIIHRYQTTIEFKLLFVPIITGRPDAPGYTLFSWPHIIDILNQCRLLIPLAPVLIILGWRSFLDRKRDAFDWFMLAFSIGGASFLILIDPRLGLGRDWDLFALSCLGPMLVLLRSVVVASYKRVILYPGIIAISFVLILPFFATNLQYQPSIDYYTWLLRQDVSRSKAGMSQLRNYYYDQGQDNLGDDLNQEILDTYPFIRLANKAVELAESGKTIEAIALADSLYAANPYAVESYIVRGLVDLKTGKYAGAVNNLERAAELGPHSAPILTNLARGYFQIGRHDLMMETLRRAQKCDSQNIGVLYGLSSAFFQNGVYDSSLVYTAKIIKSDSSRTDTWWMAGLSAYRLKRFDLAGSYLNRYLELAPEGRYSDEAKVILDRIQ